MNFSLGLQKIAAAPGIPVPKAPAPPKPPSMPAYKPPAASGWNPSMKQFPRKAPTESAQSVASTTNAEMGVR
jgi:hypothetical protein